MNEFLQMIFRSYTNTSDSKSYFGDDTDKLLDELEKILSPELNKKINDYFIDACAEIEKNAFMDGFAYACKCLSNGKIEFTN